MKKLIIFLFLIMACNVQAFPTNLNEVTIDLSKLSDGYGDYRFKWRGFDSQHVKFTLVDGSLSVTTTAFSAAWKVSKRVGSSNLVFISILDSQITKTTNSLEFNVDNTNIPPNSTKYNSELFLYDGATTNISRSGGKGTLIVTESLFDDDDGNFPFPSFTKTNLVDYLLINSAVSTYYPISNPSNFSSTVASTSGLASITYVDGTTNQNLINITNIVNTMTNAVFVDLSAVIVVSTSTVLTAANAETTSATGTVLTAANATTIASTQEVLLVTVGTGTLVTAGAGLTGGGALVANVTLNLDPSVTSSFTVAESDPVFGIFTNTGGYIDGQLDLIGSNDLVLIGSNIDNGSIIFSNKHGKISTFSLDGADSNKLTITGGGHDAGSVGRGGALELTGNENTTDRQGAAVLRSGTASGAIVLIAGKNGVDGVLLTNNTVIVTTNLIVRADIQANASNIYEIGTIANPFQKIFLGPDMDINIGNVAFDVVNNTPRFDGSNLVYVSNFEVATNALVSTGRTVTAVNGLAGGGKLVTNFSIGLDPAVTNVLTLDYIAGVGRTTDHWVVTGGLTNNGDMVIISGDIALSTGRGIGGLTDDGADTSVTRVLGGGILGAGTVDRGSVVEAFGNEHASRPGAMRLRAGNTNAGFVRIAVELDTAFMIVTNDEVRFSTNVFIASLRYPRADGTSNQVMTTDGAGTLNFETRPDEKSLEPFRASFVVTYSDGSTNWQELALGAPNTFLKSQGTTTAPKFETVSANSTNVLLRELDEDPAFGTFIMGVTNLGPIADTNIYSNVTASIMRTNLGVVLGLDVMAFTTNLNQLATNNGLLLISVNADLLDGFDSSAFVQGNTNLFLSQSDTNGFVTQIITNGGFVTQTITNGLVDISTNLAIVDMVALMDIYTNQVFIDATNASILSSGGGGGTNTFSVTFQSNDSANGFFDFPHMLDSTNVLIHVLSDFGRGVDADDEILTNANVATLDLTSFYSQMTGTWFAIFSVGGTGVGSSGGGGVTSITNLQAMGFRAELLNGTSIPNQTTTQVEFDGIGFDTHDGFDTNAWQYVFPAPGIVVGTLRLSYYTVIDQKAFQAQVFHISADLSTTNKFRSLSPSSVASTGEATPGVTFSFAVAEGDFLQAWAFNSVGSTKTVETTSQQYTVFFATYQGVAP